MPASRFDLFQEALRSVHREWACGDQGCLLLRATGVFGPEGLVALGWPDGSTAGPEDASESPCTRSARREHSPRSRPTSCPRRSAASNAEQPGSCVRSNISARTPRNGRNPCSRIAHRRLSRADGLVVADEQAPPRSDRTRLPGGAESWAYHLRSLRQLIEQQNPPAVQQSFEFIQQHPIIRDLGDYGRFVRQAITQQPLLESTP